MGNSPLLSGVGAPSNASG